jgi:hypothetical protein
MSPKITAIHVYRRLKKQLARNLQYPQLGPVPPSFDEVASMLETPTTHPLSRTLHANGRRAPRSMRADLLNLEAMPATIDLHATLGESLVEHASALARAQHTTRVTLSDAARWCAGGPAQLRAVIDALFSYAMRVMKPGGHLSVAMSEDQGRCRLTVEHGEQEGEPGNLAGLLEAFRAYGATLSGAPGRLAPRMKFRRKAERGPVSTTLWLPLAQPAS